ncbi:hypothetical protein BDV36DRAFT_271501 [Aspergillus pseudocaelatus]|uniref:Secreted protein n=1 Tax=Aspergillus pseudocaelatus TaxID=1825620 RepID=A0ABQ6W5S2_9EURO|nr:hypothetical protein BDV36DRAFT_271501 [Aspergillus pseudocaelatus]
MFRAKTYYSLAHKLLLLLTQLTSLTWMSISSFFPLTSARQKGGMKVLIVATRAFWRTSSSLYPIYYVVCYRF